MSALQLLASLRAAGVKVWYEDGEIHYHAARPSARIDRWLKQLAEHKSELIAIMSPAGQGAEGLRLEPWADNGPAPVSFEQQRFLFLNEFEGAANNYNLSSCFGLRGRLDINALSRAIQAIIAQHDILRVRFERRQGEWFQLLAERPLKVAVSDLEGLQKSYKDIQLKRLVERDSQTPFDLLDGPHLRLRVIRLSPARHWLVVVMHHIVSDGHSIRLFVDALRQQYLSYLADVPASAAPLDIQYRDYAHWQRDMLNNQGCQVELDYWREQLRDAPEVLDLDIAAARPARQSLAGGSHTFRIEASLWEAISTLCARHQVTSFHCLLAAFVLSLSRYSGEQDIVVGSPANTRRHVNSAELIGPFINMLPLRVRVAAEEQVAEFLQRVREIVLSAMDNASAPLEKVVAALAPRRSTAYAPLFQHMFVLEDVPLGIVQLPGLEISTELVDQPSAKYDTALIVQRDARGLFAIIRYRTELFTADAIARLAAAFQQLLRQFTQHPDAPVSSLDVLSAAQRQHLQQALTGSRQTGHGRCCLHQLVEQQTRRTPDRIALQFADISWTYLQLEQRANQIAHWLLSNGVTPGTVVGMALHNCIEQVCVLLAIGKCGAAYLPLAMDDPPARAGYCLRQAGVRLVVSTPAWQVAEELPVTILDISADDVIASFPMTCPEVLLDPQSLVSILYTSGSTGAPKAVMTEHSALVNNLQWMQRMWPLHATDSLLYKAPLTFDVSAKEIIWPLMVGGRVVISRPGGRHDPAYLWRMVRTADISVVHLVPTMLEYFIAESSQVSSLALRIVMCGGEALSADLARRFHAAFTAGLLHLYGPTEAAIAITGCLLPRQRTAPLPLGTPTDNSSVYLLNQDLALTPAGVIGEIFIGGLAVARGYFGQPAKTAAMFMPDPFSAISGARMYATGDLARLSADGELLFAGRRDHQLKLYGQRIEPGEIEAALRQHPRVRDCVVIAAPGAGGKPALKAFVISVDERPAQSDLSSFLRQHLAARMLPASFVYLDALPMLPNGKVDRRRLLQQAAPDNAAEAGAARALRQTERRLLTIWRELLQREQIGVSENFFSAGGHSLLAIELRNRIQTEFQCQLEVADVFAHASIEEQAQFLRPQDSVTLTGTAAVLHQPESGLAGQTPGQEIGQEPIAVIGMAGRFPAADDLQAFWSNILAGTDCVTHFSSSELLAAGYPEALISQPGFVPARAVLQDIELFDAGFFGYTPMEAALLDPQHRLLLESAQWAFDDAGYSPAALARHNQRVAVYVGISNSGYYEHHLLPRPELLQKYGSLQLALSTAKSYAATQLAFRLDLQGPALSVDTACSTSLVAIAKACQSLLLGEADLALAGGASINTPVAGGHLWQEGGVGSRDGHCRPFDAGGSGTVKGMGGGVVLLKKLAAAQRDGDHIHALVLGTAVNNDGGRKVGFTAPSVAGQSAVMKAALQQAGVPPESVAMVETHGTGTHLGDPIEIKSLASVYAGAELVLGAVKGNIGHLDAAAGVAGFIKTVLALKQRTFPPMANFEAPNEQLRLADSGLRILPESAPWPAAAIARRAAVSSFGIGGTNAHAVLQEAPECPTPVSSKGAEIVLLSAKTPYSLELSIGALRDCLRQSQAATLPEISYTLCQGRTHWEYRHALVVDEPAAIARQCDAWLADAAGGSDTDQDSMPAPARALERPRIAFMFPGQGAPVDLAVRAFYHRDAVFSHALDEAISILTELSSFDFKAHLQRLTSASEPPEYLRDVAAIQPWQFAVSMALVASLQALGVRPDWCLGHSLGEYAAACTAGVFSLHDGLAITTRRGQLVSECEPGAMLALNCTATELAEWLDGSGELSACNSPSQSIVSGTREQIRQLRKTATAMQVASKMLAADRAFHSVMMEPVLERFQDYLRTIHFSAPGLPLISNVSGELMAAEFVPDAQYWCQHLRRPVRFMQGIANLHQQTPDICLEIGAGNTLGHFALASPDRTAATEVLSLLARSAQRGLPESYLQSLAALWKRGVEINWESFFTSHGKHAQNGYRRTSLPGYQFERSRHWIAPPPPATQGHSQLDSEPGAGRYRFPSWARVPMPTAATQPHASGLLICHDDSASAEKLLHSCDRQGIGYQSASLSCLHQSAAEHADQRSLTGQLNAVLDNAAGPVRIILVSAALLRSECEATAQDTAVIPVIPLLLAALAERAEVISVAVLFTGVADVFGTGQPSPMPGLAQRALLAGQLSQWSAGHAARPKVRSIDLSAQFSAADVTALHTELAAAATGLTALRSGQRWRVLRLDAELPVREWNRSIPAGHQCLLISHHDNTAQALQEHLRQRGAGALWHGNWGLRQSDDARWSESLAQLQSARQTPPSPGELPDTSMFMLLNDAVLAGEDDLTHWQRQSKLLARIEQLLQLWQGMPCNIFVLLASSSEHSSDGLLLALDNLLSHDAVASRYVLVASGLWVDGTYPQDLLQQGFDFCTELQMLQPGTSAYVSPAALARRQQTHHRIQSEPAGVETPTPRSTANQPARLMSALEQQIAAQWEDLLGVRDIRAEDNFFALGGDSLMASQALTQLHQQLGVRIAAAEFMGSASVRQLARMIDNARQVSNPLAQQRSEDQPGETDSGRDHWEL